MILQAVILLGGKGTRIAAQFPDVPKALVPVAGRPFLEWQLDWLKTNGVSRILLAAGYKADVLERYLAARPADGLNVSLSREPRPLGTGGALKFVEPQLASDPVLVLNGDSLAPNLDLAAHGPNAGRGAPAHSALFAAPIENAGRYGTVEFDADGFVSAFREKTERSAGFVNAGIYLLPRGVIAAIPGERPVSLETEIFPALAARKQLAAIPSPPPLLDMGTPDGRAAMEAFFEGQPPI
ncbi:MAG: sugar phosphate nucleotidyltransferase [Kiritimatiellia bacterium]